MRILLALHLLFSISVCASLTSAQERRSGSLTVYAATSLTDVFEAIAAAFIEVYPDVRVLLNFANSSTLAAQLGAGAPADVFASANMLQMANVIEDGRVDEAAVEIFAHNRLVVIAPADNPAAIDAPGDLANEGVLLVLAAAGAPIRDYTDAMIAAYDSEYGEDFEARVRRNLVSEERNVRQVVARVALGEADAGVVYQSDALGDVADRLIAIPIAERHNQLASYPVAPLTDAAEPSLAADFIRFLRSPLAQAILAENGFCWPAILDDAGSNEAAPTPTREFADVSDAAEIKCEAATIENG